MELIFTDSFSAVPTRSWDSQAHEQAILSRLPQVRSRVLEIGCGDGHLASEISRMGHHVVGVDLAEDSIGRARKWYPDLQFEPGSAFENLSSLATEIDFVVSVEVIEHLMRPDLFLRNAFDALKPGGEILITTPYHGYLKNLLLSLTNRWDRHFTVDWVGGHIKFFSIRTLKTMVEKAGFESLAYTGIGRVPLLSKSILCHARRPL